MDNQKKATTGFGSRAAQVKLVPPNFNSRPLITRDFLRVIPAYLADNLRGFRHV